MKTYVVEQGSADWLNLRLGIPTASEFDKIITPKTEQFSTSSRPYALQLVAEALIKAPVVELKNIKAVERGKELEPDAAQMYEFEQGVQTSPVGFITSDDGRIGASPDRLVDGQPGAIEMKCPLAHTHLGYMVDGFGGDYRAQAQGQMLVGDFEWVDRYSYFPLLPPVRERTFRDEAFICKLRAALDQFLELRDQLMDQVLKLGAVPVEVGTDAKLDELDRIRAGRRNLFAIPSLESIDARNPLMGG